MSNNFHNIFNQNIKLLGEMDKVVISLREQEYDNALCIMANSVDRIKFIVEAIIQDKEYFNVVATETISEMLTGILKAKKDRDFILLADLLELQLINFLIGIQEFIINKEEILFDEEYYEENISILLTANDGYQEQLREPINTLKLLKCGYCVEFTSCGQMTLAAEKNGVKFYFHTNNRIQLEAFLLAKHWYRKDVSKYIIYGFGLGYHIKELLSLIEASAQIEIYEADLNVIQLACAFVNIKELLENKQIKLIYDPEFRELKLRIEELIDTEVFYVHYPSFKNIECSEGKELIKEVLPWIKKTEEY